MVALSECDARESAAKVKVVSVGDAAGQGEGGVEDRGGPAKVEELT